MHKTSLGMLVLAIIMVVSIDTAHSYGYLPKQAANFKNRQINKATPQTMKGTGFRSGVMPMKNFHKLSMALANGGDEADSSLFGPYGNGRKLNLMRTKNLGGPGSLAKTHANRIHKPISYQKQNQRNQMDRLRTLKMNVLANSELNNENQENEDEIEFQGEAPIIQNMVISNENLNIRQPHAEMLRMRDSVSKDESDESLEAEEKGVAGPPMAPPTEMPLKKKNENNERIQPVRAIATKQHMKKMQDEDMSGSYDYEEELPVPAKKPMSNRPNIQPQQRKQPSQKSPKPGKNGKRNGKFQKNQGNRNQAAFDDEDSDVHALKLMRMKKLDQQRMGLSDQASLTMELLSRQNPNMNFLKQYALSNYLSHMG